MSTSAATETTKAPEPTFVQAKPYKVDLEPGKVYIIKQDYLEKSFIDTLFVFHRTTTGK